MMKRVSNLNRLLHSATLLTLLMLAAATGGCSRSETPIAEAIQDTTEAVADAGANVAEVADSAAGAVAVAASERATPATVLPTNSGLSRTDALLAAITIFVLAIFVGFELITKVPPTLHTPLMSGSNAVSGITLVGALLMAGNNQSGWAAFFGMIAVAMAMVNVVGGFLVTDRMLSMFKSKR